MTDKRREDRPDEMTGKTQRDNERDYYLQRNRDLIRQLTGRDPSRNRNSR